ncbi:MAG: hypothetical protein ACK53L_12320 [Pirellulaceae bacterium]|jgi:hypothetical protein
MAIATLTDYKTALTSPREIVRFGAVGSAVTAGRLFDYWQPQAIPGVAPTTAVVPTSTTTGALGQQNAPSGKQLSILGGHFTGTALCNYIVCDRLSHQGGLSGIVTTAQTTNLPTAALTRYTSGDGVMLGVTIYTQIGTTGTTITATYTNQSGVGSRVTPTVIFGGTGFREPNRLLLLPLESGDSGVQSVESVTVAGTTGTAGNFGVTLFKPLYVLCNDQASTVLSSAGFISGQNAGGVAKVENDACLFFALISSSSTAAVTGSLILQEN